MFTDEESKGIMTKYNMFLSKAEVYGIQDCFSWMPLVDVGDVDWTRLFVDRKNEQKG